MSKRREGRETAVQFLFSNDFAKTAKPSDWEAFWKLHTAPAPAREFCMELVDGVLSHIETIDERIQQAAENYALHRLSGVDRNVLRVAIYELLYVPEVPPVVAMNEAIDIAKRFGTEESGRFVNGLLDSIASALQRPLREASRPDPETASPSPSASAEPVPQGGA